ncbi:MAG: cobalt ECF transporter T component CbiQ [Candidatus Geothermincolia bacterium]
MRTGSRVELTAPARPLHRLDPRAKLLALLVLVVTCVSTPPARYPAFGVYAALLAVGFAVARPNARMVVRRVAAVLPLIIAAAVFIPLFKQGGNSYQVGPLTLHEAGLTTLWNVAVKSSVSVFAVVLLGTVTTFAEIMQGLEGLHAPRLLVTLLNFTHRYLFVLREEAARMRRARDSRGWSGRWIWHARVVGQMIGHLFLRSYERGERVYAAMLARGYDGEVRSLERLRLHRADALFTSLIAAAAVTARVVA